MSSSDVPPIVLFGYDSSAFTQKIRMALKLRQIPYTFVIVPSMMPRPILVSNFNLTYRKIPVMAVGKEVYVDTSLIFEVIASLPAYRDSSAHPPLYPDPVTRSLTRVLSSHYTDRPFFRLMTGMIPQAVWESSFGEDRAELIGHKLDAAKLGAKIPRNLAAVDTYLSILEPLFATADRKWFLGTELPSGADISFFYQLHWGYNIAKGVGVGNLTAGEVTEGTGEGMDGMFNKERYPGLWSWYERMIVFFENLKENETRIETSEAKKIEAAMSVLDACEQPGPVPLLETAVKHNEDLDGRIGLKVGARVSIAPDDTGRDDPTLGMLVAMSSEEVVIVPDVLDGAKARVEDIRVHFPRVAFVVRPLGSEESGEVTVRISTTAKPKL